MKAQSDNPLPHAVQSSTPARVIRRQSSVKPSHRLPLTPVLLPAALALLLRDAATSTRPASLLPPPAPSPSGLSLLLSLSVLRKHLRCCTHGMLQAPV